MRSSGHVTQDMPEQNEPPDVPEVTELLKRRPYRAPSLRVFGSVAAITATISMDGSAMDGGPNNIKT